MHLTCSDTLRDLILYNKTCTSLLRSNLNFNLKSVAFFDVPKLFPRFCSLCRRMIQQPHYNLPPPFPIYICQKRLKRHMKESYALLKLFERAHGTVALETCSSTLLANHCICRLPDFGANSSALLKLYSIQFNAVRDSRQCFCV